MGNASRSERTGTGRFVHISQVVKVVMADLDLPDRHALARRQRNREILAKAREQIRTRKLYRQPGGTWAPKAV